MAGAATASSHAAPSSAPLVQPQLAKRAVSSFAQQKHSQPAKPPRATASPASCTGNTAAGVISAGYHGDTAEAPQSNAARSQLHSRANPSIAKRKHAAAHPIAIGGTAGAPLASCCGADQSATQSAAAPQLLPQPSMAARLSIAHRKPAAAKPPAAKRRAAALKAPALGTIAEVSVSPPEPPASAAPAAPGTAVTAAASGGSFGSSHVAASAGRDVGSQPPASAKPPARQRTKAADLDATAVHAKVVQKHAEGKLTDLTVPEAKCWLKGRKLPLKGKKEELVARIAEALLQR